MKEKKDALIKRKTPRFLRRWKLLVLLPAVFLIAILLPQPAYASVFGDILGLDDWFKGLLCDGGIALWNVYFGTIDLAANSSVVTGNFTNLFGNASVWEFARTAHQTLVIPLGESILALFMLVQLVKISQRIDATATLPAVKDIVFLAVTYVLMHWLIVNSLDIVTQIYDIFTDIAKGFGSSSGLAGSALDKGLWDSDKATIGGCILFILVGFLSMLVGFLAYLVTLVVSLARGIQLYVLAAFAPIPLSLLGFDETRQMGIGFLKNFCAAALAGAIIMFLLTVYPYIVTATGGNPTASGTIFSLTYENNFIDVLAIVLGWIGTSIMLIIGLIKSGAWAKEILGG